MATYVMFLLLKNIPSLFFAISSLSFSVTSFLVTVTAKIRNLKDYHSRMINGVTPVASGADIANTLKYFSQALLGYVCLRCLKFLTYQWNY